MSTETEGSVDPREEASMQVLFMREQAGDPDAEEGLSIKDWADRVQGAVRTAFRAARAGDHETETFSWAEASAYALGRVEQLIRFEVQAACEHEWPARRLPQDRCVHCGLMLGDGGV